MRISICGTGPTFRVNFGGNLSVRLRPVHGEEGRFLALSDTRHYCHTCGVRFTRKADGVCQRCGNQAEPVPYMVDVTENRGRTKCSCESFTCNRRDEPPEGAVMEPCKHGAAALVLFGFIKAAQLSEQHGKAAERQAARREEPEDEPL